MYIYGHSFHLCNLVNEKWLQIRNISVSIRVDGSSASGTERKLEPAAAGTRTDDSLLDKFLEDLFQKNNCSSDSKMIDTKTVNLPGQICPDKPSRSRVIISDSNMIDTKTVNDEKFFSFLADLFRSKARPAPAVRAHGHKPL